MKWKEINGKTDNINQLITSHNQKLLTMVSCHQGKKSKERKMNVQRAQSINVCRRELKTKCGGLTAKPSFHLTDSIQE